MDAAVSRQTAHVRVFPDLEALSYAAAAFFTEASRPAIQSTGRFAVAISGGTTPRRLYELLGSDRYARAIDWHHVHIFWADERCVPPEDSQSNFKLASDTFLGKVALPGKNLHRIRGEGSPELGASEYEKILRTFFNGSAQPAFDLVMLGVGEDGHTASLFPGSPALKEQNHIAVPICKQSRAVDRISLTLPALNAAHQVLFLVAGSTKAYILQKILEDPGARGTYPAGLVCPANGSVTWLVDEAAARLLRESAPRA